MRIRLILSFLLLLPFVAAAQVKFGYISYAEVCQQMPSYQQAQQQLAELKKKYDDEATRGEEEFQRKFADFLQGQKDFPANILQKRQAELQDIMERGIDFRKDAEALLSKAEKDMMQEVYSQLNAAITAVAMEQGYAFVLNTDGNAAPYINPQLGDNVTDLVRVRLGILKELPKTEETPDEQSVEQSTETPLVQPVDQSAEQPANQSTEQPAEQSTEQPAKQSTEQPTEQSEQPTEPTKATDTPVL